MAHAKPIQTSFFRYVYSLLALVLDMSKQVNAWMLVSVLLIAMVIVLNNNEEDHPEFLFVLNAEGMNVNNSNLTLSGVSNLTVWFTDRPYHEAGHMYTRVFVDSWTDGGDSFAENPPNAVLTWNNGTHTFDTVIELQMPTFSEENMSISVPFSKISGTNITVHEGAISLFIDSNELPHPVRCGNLLMESGNCDLCPRFHDCIATP